MDQFSSRRSLLNWYFTHYIECGSSTCSGIGAHVSPLTAQNCISKGFVYLKGLRKEGISRSSRERHQYVASDLGIAEELGTDFWNPTLCHVQISLTPSLQVWLAFATVVLITRRICGCNHWYLSFQPILFFSCNVLEHWNWWLRRTKPNYNSVFPI